MNSLEKLIAEYEDELNFEFKMDMPDRLTGLIAGNTVYINANVPFDRVVATLAEEIGHYKTLADQDITNYKEIETRKFENRARNWSYRKLVPFTKLEKYLQEQDTVHKYELAEEMGVPEDIIEEAIEMYRKEGFIGW